MRQLPRCAATAFLSTSQAGRKRFSGEISARHVCRYSDVGRSGQDIRFRLPAATTTPSGAILPEPKRTRFGLLSVITAVMTGLLIGATLSKLMANFLEEKELFVPSDDDDDDDDDD